MEPPEGVRAFALRLLVWLVPTFAVWYLVAPAHERPVAWLAALMLDAFANGMTGAIEFAPRVVTFVTSLHARTAEGQAGLVEVEVNPLLYTYGSALFAALMLASGARWTRLLAGLALLLPVHAWGVAFDAIGQVLRMDRAIVAQAGLAGWRAEAAAVGYQLGSLVLPALAPIALWVLLQRAFVERIAGLRLAR